MILDLIAALIITYGFYRGYSNGLINTVVDTLSILVALVVALKFSPILIDYLQETCMARRSNLDRVRRIAARLDPPRPCLRHSHA